MAMYDPDRSPYTKHGHYKVRDRALAGHVVLRYTEETIGWPGMRKRLVPWLTRLLATQQVTLSDTYAQQLLANLNLRSLAS